MSEVNELDKTIEELEAEVIAELEEANDELAEAGADAPKKGSLPSEKGSKVEGERQDTGAAVVDGEQSSAPAKAVAAKAKEVSGDAQQKDSEKDEKMNSKRSPGDTNIKGAPAQGKNVHPRKKASDTTADHIAAGDEVDHDGEDLSESPKTKAEHLAVFEKMTATEIKKMYSSHNAVSVSEDDADEDEEEIRDQEAIEAAKKEAVEKRIKDIDVKEDVDALMSSDDSLSEEFKEKAATIFEAAVKTRVRSEVERIHEEVASEKQSEMDTFKDELSEKVDTYLNYVVEEWTKENELAIERGLKGEIAEDFISGLQQLFEDHYIDVPDEKYDVLEAQSDKISELEEKLNTEISKSMEVKESNNSLVREQVISEVSEDLADTEVEKFKSLTQDVEFSNEESFKEKLNTLKESYFPKSQPSTSDDLDNETDGSAQDVDTSKSMKSYLNAISASKARAS
ncbi:uncharacterized protein METZ01_LOCUS213998 [marine metagenome]|uniref:Prohead core protein n=1 Tax=marine metagenome TaxID=408172 RepID=A0A382FFQ3_9ZZZZ